MQEPEFKLTTGPTEVRETYRAEFERVLYDVEIIRSGEGLENIVIVCKVGTTTFVNARADFLEQLLKLAKKKGRKIK